VKNADETDEKQAQRARLSWVQTYQQTKKEQQQTHAGP